MLYLDYKVRETIMNFRLNNVTLAVFLLPLITANADIQQRPDFTSPNQLVSQEKGDDQANSLANKSEPRGKLLYENHCQVCHDSKVHIREDHRAKSKMDIQYWVIRWSLELKLDWSLAEVADVVNYLAEEYYQFEEKD